MAACLPVFSQSLFDSDATATYVRRTCIPDEEPNPREYRYSYDGDTVVDGKSYLRLMVESEHGRSVEGYVRQEGSKIFRLSPNAGDPEPYLVYDFGMQPGDTADVPMWNMTYEPDPETGVNIPTGIYHITYRKVKCRSVSELESQGRTLRVVNLAFVAPEEDIEISHFGFWIENVGATFNTGSPLENVYFDYLGISAEIRNIYCGDDLFFDSAEASYRDLLDRFFDSAGMAVGPAERPDPNSPKYRLDGLPFGEGDRGIYIQDGKRYIRR